MPSSDLGLPGAHASPRSMSLASSWVTQMPSRSPRLHSCTGCLRILASRWPRQELERDKAHRAE